MDELPDWVQEFRENLVDARSPSEARRNPELGHREQKWNRFWCKHSVYTHFPKAPNCDICLKTKTTRARITKFSVKKVNRETIIDMLWWYKTLQHSAYNPIACKTKTSQETQKSLMKFLEPTRKPKVINTVKSLEFGKSCEEFSWTHCTSTPHRSETNGLQKEQCVE